MCRLKKIKINKKLPLNITEGQNMITQSMAQRKEKVLPVLDNKAKPKSKLLQNGVYR